jgi:hypothetical protein
VLMLSKGAFKAFLRILQETPFAEDRFYIDITSLAGVRSLLHDLR